jgi:hypothetical protein
MLKVGSMVFFKSQPHVVCMVGAKERSMWVHHPSGCVSEGEEVCLFLNKLALVDSSQERNTQNGRMVQCVFVVADATLLRVHPEEVIVIRHTKNVVVRPSTSLKPTSRLVVPDRDVISANAYFLYSLQVDHWPPSSWTGGPGKAGADAAGGASCSSGGAAAADAAEAQAAGELGSEVVPDAGAPSAEPPGDSGESHVELFSSMAKVLLQNLKSYRPSAETIKWAKSPLTKLLPSWTKHPSQGLAQLARDACAVFQVAHDSAAASS